MRRLFPILALAGISCVSLGGIRTVHTVPGTLIAPYGTGVPAVSTSPLAVSGGGRDVETFAVYDVLLEEGVFDDRIECIVVKDHTTARYLVEEDEAIPEHIRRNFPDLPQEVWDDFTAWNQEAVPLQPAFHIVIPVILISREEIEEFFSTPDGGGWEAFYDTYKGAQGIMELSQVGFSTERNRAIVYAGNEEFSLAGAGFLYLLEKDGADWRMVKSVMVWIS